MLQAGSHPSLQRKKLPWKPFGNARIGDTRYQVHFLTLTLHLIRIKEASLRLVLEKLAKEWTVGAFGMVIGLSWPYVVNGSNQSLHCNILL